VFLEAYREATEALPHAWEDAGGADATLALFSIEKTAYEVAYEAENRPAWLTVPLQGLAALAQQISHGGSQ
jgi:maltose alpha-D-glucosyltransferase/alpha-amylase